MTDPRTYQPSKDALKDRVILITGASDGIGKAVAIAAAAHGAQVVLHGRNVRKLEGVYDAIVNAGNPRPSILPLDFENLSVVEDHVHEGPRGRYLVLHGDIFDTATRNFVFLAHLGDWGYRALLSLNRIYNGWRAWRGKEYWSLSKAIKAKAPAAIR